MWAQNKYLKFENLKSGKCFHKKTHSKKRCMKAQSILKHKEIIFQAELERKNNLPQYIIHS